ncbi:hypothetical protein OESDEN_01397, partial [Oesophagostomum dentatum]
LFISLQHKLENGKRSLTSRIYIPSSSVPSRFSPKKARSVQARDILESLVEAVNRLRSIEAQMQKMRKECQEREKIWEAVEREVNFLEEKAVIYRYKLMDTQSLHD